MNRSAAGNARNAKFSKKQKNIKTTYAEEFGKKNIPLQREPDDIDDLCGRNDDLEWFFGPSAKATERSSDDRNARAGKYSQKFDAGRWDRLHFGLTPTQSQAIGLGQATKDAKPQWLRQRCFREVSEKELSEAEPLQPFDAKSFPPIVRRPDSPEKVFQPKENHYQYFAKLCLSENTDKRRVMEQKAIYGKSTGRRNVVPSLNATLASQSSRGSWPVESPNHVLLKGSSKPSSTAPKRKVELGEEANDDADGAAKRESTIKMPGKLDPNSSARNSMLKPRTSARLVPARSMTGQLDGKPPVSQSKKTACDDLRNAIFGKIGNEEAKTDKEASIIYEESQGVQADVIKLFMTWKELDEDMSGDVDFKEFMHFFRGKGMISIIGERALKSVFGGNEGKYVTLEDLMRILWPRCEDANVVAMKSIIGDFKMAGHKEEKEVELPRELLDELRDTFCTVDEDGNGSVSIKELVSSGLMAEEKAVETMSKFGRTEEEDLNWDDFLEIMCPQGYCLPGKLKQK